MDKELISKFYFFQTFNRILLFLNENYSEDSVFVPGPSRLVPVLSNAASVPSLGVLKRN